MLKDTYVRPAKVPCGATRTALVCNKTWTARPHHAEMWWRTNRSSSSGVFLDELSAVLRLVAEAVQVGYSCRRSPVPGTRHKLH